MINKLKEFFEAHKEAVYSILGMLIVSIIGVCMLSPKVIKVGDCVVWDEPQEPWERPSPVYKVITVGKKKLLVGNGIIADSVWKKDVRKVECVK